MCVDIRWAEGLKYLLDLDFRHKLKSRPPSPLDGITSLIIDASQREPSSDAFAVLHEHFLDVNTTCEVTEMVLSLRQEDTRAQDVRMLLRSLRDPAYHESYLKRFLEDPICNDHDLFQVAWHEVLKGIIVELHVHSLCSDKLYMEAITRWSAAVRILIEQGADIHQPMVFIHPSSSAYMDILMAANSTVDADGFAHEWLRTLKSCGVLIGPYIERETRTFHKYWGDHPWGGRRGIQRLVTIQFEGIPTLSWRWSVSPGDEAFQFLAEFENLIRGDIYGCGLRPPFVDSHNDFTPWFESKMPDERRQQNFPYRPTFLDDPWLGDFRKLDEVNHLTYKMALKVREGRLARREARKWRKAHPGERLSTQVMPGS